MRNPIIVGERVYLRAVEEGDGMASALAYARETDDFTDDYGRYLMSPIYYENAQEKEADEEKPSHITLTSCLKENDEAIGWLGYFDLNLVNGTAETFSFFRPGDWRGRGYGTESKLLLLEYGFDRLGLHVIRSFVFGPNERSWRALGRQGYQPAGKLRWDNTRRGVYQDTFVFDILRDEWQAAKDAWAERRAKERAGHA